MPPLKMFLPPLNTRIDVCPSLNCYPLVNNNQLDPTNKICFNSCGHLERSLFFFLSDMNAYTQRLSVINAIRETASKYGRDVQINLAQMVVIGDQSSGKSSLLTELTGIPFPSKSGMTTKRPIVANTVNTSEESLQFFKVLDLVIPSLTKLITFSKFSFF